MSNIMPEGPLGFPRATDLGPFTSKTDMEVVEKYITSGDMKRKPEADMRRTILELDEIAGAGRTKVRVLWESMLFQRGNMGEYDGQSIDITIEPVFLAMRKEDRFEPYLKALTAHEYGHVILEQKNSKVYDSILNLYDQKFFHYRDLDDIVEFYEFPDEQYRGYESIGDFIDHLMQFRWNDAARPVEGFCNSLAARYSGLSFDEYHTLKATVNGNKAEISDQLMIEGVDEADFPEVWEIEW